jgi:hypothetical protein
MPNQPVPAADLGWPKRRALFASIPPAITVGAILSVANAEMVVTAKPDAELIELGHQLQVAWAQEKELFALCRDSISDCTEGEADAVWKEAGAAHEACSKIVASMEELQAHTLAGIRVKVMALSWTHNGEEFSPDFFGGDATDFCLAAQIMRDLSAMGDANG